MNSSELEDMLYVLQTRVCNIEATVFPKKETKRYNVYRATYEGPFGVGHSREFRAQTLREALIQAIKYGKTFSITFLKSVEENV